MNVENLYLKIYSFIVVNPWAGVLALVALLLFIWKKPKQFLKYVGGLLALVVVIYLLSYIAETMMTGIGNKQEITTERESRLKIDE